MKPRKAPALATNTLYVTVYEPTARYTKPSAQLLFSEGAHGWPMRAALAVLHLAAARAEAHTPGREGWVISVEGMNCAGGKAISGTITIELVDGTKAETERALKLLRAVAQTFEGATYNHARGNAYDADGNALL